MKSKNRDILVSCLITFIILFLLLTGVKQTQTKNRVIRMKSTEDAVHRAVTRYYRINGVYPSDVEKLCRDYGIIYDTDELNIKYVLFSSNIYPDITVMARNRQE